MFIKNTLITFPWSRGYDNIQKGCDHFRIGQTIFVRQLNLPGLIISRLLPEKEDINQTCLELSARLQEACNSYKEGLSCSYEFLKAVEYEINYAVINVENSYCDAQQPVCHRVKCQLASK